MTPPRELGLPASLLAKQTRCVYGTRDAGMIWEETYRSALEGMGFVAGKASPCCFHHASRGISLVVHGDDLTALGLKADLDWYEAQLAKCFKLKIRGRLGEDCELKEMRILNRIITLTDEGVLYEADPRHHELMIRNLGLEHGKGAVTPGIKPVDLESEAMKDGAPEPWDDSVWQEEEDRHAGEDAAAGPSISASMIDLNDYEAKKEAIVNKIFAVKRPLKIAGHDPMDVDSIEPEDDDMGINDTNNCELDHNFSETPLHQPLEISASDNWKFEKVDNWADAMDITRKVYFNDHVDVHVVPNFLGTYFQSPRSFVLGKKGVTVPLTRHHDPFTGILKSEVKERRLKMSKTCRWTLKSKNRRAILDVLTSEFMDKIPLWAAITKPKMKGGPKRSGARATKKLEQLQSKGHVLEAEEATAYRGLSARGNYLSADRPDVSYSTKELCREFARPNQTSFLKLKRTARYLKSHGRLVYNFPWGENSIPDEDYIDIFVDTDFAGCAQTRRSTSGGVILYHGHCVKHWSTTQTTLSLSSGESELHGISKGVSLGLGMQSLILDLGFKVKVRVHSDACAAIGIARRRGLGRVRHLHVEDLWVQSKVREGHVDLVKVKGAENPADMLTKYVSADILEKMLKIINLRFLGGRSSIAPELPPETVAAITANTGRKEKEGRL